MTHLAEESEFFELASPLRWTIPPLSDAVNKALSGNKDLSGTATRRCVPFAKATSRELTIRGDDAGQPSFLLRARLFLLLHLLLQRLQLLAAAERHARDATRARVRQNHFHLAVTLEQ